MDFSQTKDVSFETLIPLIQDCLARGKNVWIYPKGTSMLPMIRQGVDKVLLSPLPDKLKKYDLPFYRRDNGQFVLHRIVEAGETYTCLGDNQFILERCVRQEQMIAVVSAFERNGKNFSVNRLSYQLYCRFWHYTRPIRHFCYLGMIWFRRHTK